MYKNVVPNAAYLYLYYIRPVLMRNFLLKLLPDEHVLFLFLVFRPNALLRYYVKIASVSIIHSESPLNTYLL